MVAARPDQAVVRVLLERHPRTFAAELGIRRLDTPSGLFRLLVLALLSSARISSSIALDAARALSSQGWRTAQRMAEASWAERTAVLNRAGYARFDERTSTMLHDTAELLLERYRGDLRRLRDAAGRRPDDERRRLKACQGIGDVGVDIFFREVQQVWTELQPFADRRALSAAGRLGLPTTAEGLAALAPGGDMARLVSALVRVDVAHEADAVRAAAAA